jgi:hypothetical protein
VSDGIYALHVHVHNNNRLQISNTSDAIHRLQTRESSITQHCNYNAFVKRKPVQNGNAL